MRFCLAFSLLVLLCACAARRPIDVPEFSEFSFTGNAYSGGMPMPVQGSLTKRGDELKFALAARQGMVLGYGTIDAKSGKAELLFSRSSGARRLLGQVGEALMELMPAIQKHELSTRHWLIGNDGMMRYHSAHLDLAGRLKGEHEHY